MSPADATPRTRRTTRAAALGLALVIGLPAIGSTAPGNVTPAGEPTAELHTAPLPTTTPDSRVGDTLEAPPTSSTATELRASDTRSGPTPEPDRAPPAPALAWELAQVLEAQMAVSTFWSPGVEVAIAVEVDGATVAMTNGTTVVASASTAKVIWTVAAVDAAGLDAVEPFAEAVFVHSDNDAAGRIIDLVGVDAINEFTGAIGMDDTYLSGWSFGVTRTASDRAERGRDNTTSATDIAHFLDLLARGELLDAGETAQVLQWMQLSPDDTDDPTIFGSVLVRDLTPDVAAEVAHKAGWLPPGCCTSFENVLVSAGAVPVADGGWYTVAITTANGADYDGQAAWISATVAAIDDTIRARIEP